MQAFIKSQRASINFKIIVKSGLALKSVVPRGGVFRVLVTSLLFRKFVFLFIADKPHD